MLKFFTVSILLFSSIAVISQSSPSTSNDLKERADSLYEKRSFKEAAQLYLNISETEKHNTQNKGRNMYMAGKAYDQAGDWKSAEYWFNSALEIYKELKDKESYYKTIFELAGVADNFGDYEKAVNLMIEAKDYHVKMNDSVQVARTLNNLALFYYHDGEIQKAIEMYYQSIDWVGNLLDNLKAVSFNQLGNIWADELKDEQKALEFYQESLKLKLNFATPQSISASYNNIGISHKNLGQLDSAMHYYKIALDYASKSNIPDSKASPLINIGNLYKREKNYKEAIAYYSKVLDISEQISIRLRANVHINIGTAFKELGSFSEAKKHLAIAESLIDEVGGLNDLADVLLQKALVYQGMNNYKEALNIYIQYSDIKDSIFTRKNEQELANVMVKYEAAEKDLKILEQQQTLQFKELQMQKGTLFSVSIIAFVLAIAGVMFYLFKRKQAVARRTALELELAEQKRIAHIQEDRLRISRELHDNIGSYLTLMSASVEHVAENGNNSAYTDIKESLSMSMRELRKTVWLLNKQAVSVDELAIRLRDFFKPLQSNGLRISVSATGESETEMSEVQTTHIFRIVQEAVNNSYKYAACSEISVHLFVNNKTLHFSITDNGKGFDPLNNKKGNGIRNLHSRIEELGGDLSITSFPENGTKIEGSFQIEKILSQVSS